MLTPTILRGGSGSRRCPVTRELHPKPSIRRADGQCLLGKVFLRGAPPPSVAEILTITNRELFFETDDDFRELNTTRLATTFVLEPLAATLPPTLPLRRSALQRRMVKKPFCSYS